MPISNPLRSLSPVSTVNLDCWVYADAMDGITSRLAEIQRNIEIVGADPATRYGFTQVPNFILKSQAISPGAKLAYAMLLHYAWQNNFCFPGQERLADDMGVGKRSVIRFMAELDKAGFTTVKRRGLGQTNLYQLHLQPTKKGNDKARSKVMS